MYRPNPFKLSTLHAWIEEAHNELEQVSANVVMKYIHKHHPGVLFSPHWFNVQYRRYINSVASG